MKTMEINHVSVDAAYAIVRRDLQRVVNRMIRKAHAKGARGRKARAEYIITGPLLDASIRLGSEFEKLARECLPSDVWTMNFGYTLIHHAPGVMIIRLR